VNSRDDFSASWLWCVAAMRERLTSEPAIQNANRWRAPVAPVFPDDPTVQTTFAPPCREHIRAGVEHGRNLRAAHIRSLGDRLSRNRLALLLIVGSVVSVAYIAAVHLT
jgi:hypothetical protein